MNEEDEKRTVRGAVLPRLPQYVFIPVHGGRQLAAPQLARATKMANLRGAAVTILCCYVLLAVLTRTLPLAWRRRLTWLEQASALACCAWCSTTASYRYDYQIHSLLFIADYSTGIDHILMPTGLSKGIKW